MKRSLKEQMEQQESELAKELHALKEKTKATHRSKKRKILGSVNAATSKQNRRFLRVSGHEIDTVNIIKGKSPKQFTRNTLNTTK